MDNKIRLYKMKNVQTDFLKLFNPFLRSNDAFVKDFSSNGQAQVKIADTFLATINFQMCINVSKEKFTYFVYLVAHGTFLQSVYQSAIGLFDGRQPIYERMLAFLHKFVISDLYLDQKH